MTAIPAFVLWLCTMFGVPADQLGVTDPQLTRGSNNPQEIGTDTRPARDPRSPHADTTISNGF